MATTDLPSDESLFLPVLQAVDQIGGSGHYGEIDGMAMELAGITETQQSVLSTAGEPRILHRIGWTRSSLKRIGALESVSFGVWAITDLGRSYLEMPEREALSSIRQTTEEAWAPKAPTEELLAEWVAMAKADRPKTMTIRQFVSLWGASRRWTSVNQRIQARLREHSLETVPDFRAGSLDLTIVINYAGPEPTVTETDEADAITLTVGNLPSATGGITSVSPTDALLRAQSLMSAHDYSQLAVLSGPRSLKGAISWESIARARLRHSEADLAACLVEPPVVSLDAPLLEAVPQIADTGYVLCINGQRIVCGIVTAADLAEQFASVARPFILIGEIERLLRIELDRRFSPADLQEFLDPDDSDRGIEGAHSLTLGEVQRVLQSPDTWNEVGWPADRRVFNDHLDQVREIRNEIAHFSPDPLDDEANRCLGTFLRWTRELVLG